MLFNFKALQYSFCSCVRNTSKIVTFVIGRMKLVSVVNVYSDMSLSKGHIGPRGKASKHKPKDSIFIFPMTNVTI